MTPSRALAALACAATLAGCGDKVGPQNITAAAPGAFVKFFNFGVNAPGVNFYANDAKVTAINSTTGTESTTGTAYGAAGSGGLYSGLTPGQYTFTGRIAAATDKDLVIATAPAQLADGKSYSFYLSGIYNTTTKQADAFVLEDAYPTTVSFDSTYIRFVNAIANAAPLTLYVRNTTSAVESQISQPVAYKAGGPFLAFAGGGVVDLVVRTAGVTTPAFTRTAVSFSPGRVYTVTARGDITVTSTTATNRPSLDLTANR